MRMVIGAASCCLALWFATGCGPRAEPLAPVQGRVLYRGQPLPYGTIVFAPDAARGTRGHLAIADIQPDGTFTLKTNEVLGAVAGHHKVTISCIYPATPGAGPRSLLPVKYRDPAHSGLVREVIANKMNSFEFELE